MNGGGSDGEVALEIALRWGTAVDTRVRVDEGQVLALLGLDRRIEDREFLESEIAAWERSRNDSAARIRWMFTAEKARVKMGKAYPQLSPPAPAN